MKTIITLALIATLAGCSINAEPLDKEYVIDFAQKVRCAIGYKQQCWCFVASRKTGATSTSGIGLTHAPKEMCGIKKSRSE